MSWAHIEEEIELRADITHIGQILENQERVVNWIKSRKFEMEKRLRHLEYRRSIDERSTKVKVETKGEIQ